MNLVIEVLQSRGVRLRPLFDKDKDGEPKIDKKTGKPRELLPTLLLSPGENDVDKRQWDDHLSEKWFKAWLADDMLVNRGEGVAEDILKALPTEMPPEDMTRHIGATKDLNTLRQWRSHGSAAAMKLIDNRITELVSAQSGAAQDSN